MSKKNETKSPNQFYQRIAWSFIFLTIFLLAVVVYFSISEAKIIITPKNEVLATDFSVWVGEQEPVEKVEYYLAGKLIDETLIKEKDYQVKEFIERPAKAAGQVIITNKQKRSQTLVATTRLLSADNVLFRLKKTVVVPAGGDIITEVEADLPGSGGNIGPAVFTIPGLSESLRPLVIARSQNSMTGGILRVGQLKQSDLDQAKTDLIADLEREMLSSLIEKAGLNNLDGLDKEFSEVKFSNEVGREVSSFKASAKLRVSGMVINKESLLGLAKEVIKNQNEQNGRRITDYNLASFSYKLVEWSKERKHARYQVQLSAQTEYAKNQIFVDKNSLKGLTAVEAKARLENMPEIGQVEIKLWPWWVRQIPNNVKKIIIE